MDYYSLYEARFVIDPNKYLLQQPDGSYRARFDCITPDNQIRKHLNGEITMAFPAECPHGYSKWICFDDDNMQPETDPGNLNKLSSFLTEQGYYSLREGKRAIGNGLSKQGHLWVFLSEPIKASYARGWARHVLQLAALAGVDNFEVFPAATSFNSIARGVRGPLSRHAKANNDFIWFEHVPQEPEAQLIHLLSQPVNAIDQIMLLGEKQAELMEARNKYRENTIKAKPRQGGPTVLGMLIELNYPLVNQGNYFTTRCPLCAAEGHDRSGDNLHVAKDGTWYGCWYEGWNQEHRYGHIYGSLLKKTGRV
jgi:hypothetical protein